MIRWTLKGLELCNHFFVDFNDLNSLSRVRHRSPWLRLLNLSSYRSFRLPGSALALARTVGRASSLCSKSGLARLHFHWRLFDRRLRPAHRRRLNASTITNDFLHCNSLAKSLERIFTLKLGKLIRRVLVEELINGEVASTDLDGDLITLDFNSHTL